MRGMMRLAIMGVPGAQGEATAFAGPYDGISFLAAYGTRRLLTSYTGDCVLLRRSTDDAEQAFGFTAAGDLDTAAITTWLSGGTAYVKTWYDQSGNGRDVSQDETLNQPLLDLTKINNRPTLIGGGVTGLGRTVGAWYTGASATVFSVWTQDAEVLTTRTAAFKRNGGISTLSLTGRSSNRRGITVGDGETDTSTGFHIGVFPAGEDHIETLILDGVMAYGYRYGVPYNPVTLSQQMDDSGGNATQFWLQPGDGSTEWLFYDGILSDADVNVIGQSMVAYYGGTWTNFI